MVKVEDSKKEKKIKRENKDDKVDVTKKKVKVRDPESSPESDSTAATVKFVHSSGDATSIKSLKVESKAPSDSGVTCLKTEDGVAAIDTAVIKNYRVSKESLKVLAAKGIEKFFPIQEKVFDSVYDGRHVIGRARTGTGKTLAFSLPSIESLHLKNEFLGPDGRRHNRCRMLVLLPTRELAQQVATEIITLECNRFGTAILVGGLPEEPQKRALRESGNVVVGTPGRVLDFLNRELLDLTKVKVLVLDEADVMLEMGFREDVDAILDFVASRDQCAKKPIDFQVLLFTATLPSWIAALSAKYMSDNKVVVDVVKDQHNQTATGIAHLAIMCNFQQRSNILDILTALYSTAQGRVIIFVEMKAQANEIAMNSSISSQCQVLHGDIPQKQREATLKAFKAGSFKYLVATDVAARGIHVDDVTLVIQYEPPKDVDTFVHRSGRTGRAGTSGTNIVLFRAMDTPFLMTIEKTTGIKFKRVGVPQTKDLLKSSASRLADKVLTLSDAKDLIDTREAADLLIAQLGATEAVGRLLMELSGVKGNKAELQISTLTGREEQKTYQIKFHSKTVNTKAYVWQALTNAFDDDGSLLSKAGPLLLLADSSGAVFDVSKEALEEFDKRIDTRFTQYSNSFSISSITELPEVYDQQFDSSRAPVSYDTRNPNSRNKRPRDNGGGNGYRNNNFNGGNGYKQQRTNFGTGRR